MQEPQEMQLQSLGWEDPLEKEMATHYIILSCEIPQIEELGGLQSMGSKESDMIELLSTHVPTITCTATRRLSCMDT